MCRGRAVRLRGPLVMAIVNATPDSFFAGSRTPSPDEAVARGAACFRAGADIVDVGGESTRPGAAEVPAAEEAARVVPVVRGLREACPEGLISVDTRHSAVARAALEAGADIVNDVAGLTPEPGMAAAVDNRVAQAIALAQAQALDAFASDKAALLNQCLFVFGHFFRSHQFA